MPPKVADVVMARSFSGGYSVDHNIRVERAGRTVVQVQTGAPPNSATEGQTGVMCTFDGERHAAPYAGHDDPRLLDKLMAAQLQDRNGGSPQALFAVVEGHGGDAVSTFVRDEIARVTHDIFQLVVDNGGGAAGAAALPFAAQAAAADLEGTQAHLFNAFLELDRRLGAGEGTNPVPIGSAMAQGATAAVALVRGRMLYVANVGDVKAAMMVDGEIKVLTSRHGPENAADVADAGIVAAFPRSFGHFSRKPLGGGAGISARPSVSRTQLSAACVWARREPARARTRARARARLGARTHR